MGAGVDEGKMAGDGVQVDVRVAMGAAGDKVDVMAAAGIDSSPCREQPEQANTPSDAAKRTIPRCEFLFRFIFTPPPAVRIRLWAPGKKVDSTVRCGSPRNQKQFSASFPPIASKLEYSIEYSPLDYIMELCLFCNTIYFAW